jgi:hypothetical protein
MAADIGIEAAADMAALFAADLVDAGLACRVEARERLAVVYPAAGCDLDVADDTIRRHVVGLGRKRGFTHVAIALAEAGG